MIKHIVLFKLKEFENNADKVALLNQIKIELEALKNKIQVLKAIEVGINVNSKEEFDFSLVSDFDTMEDLAIYAAHPEHVAIAKTLIGPHKVGRSCVDYQY